MFFEWNKDYSFSFEPPTSTVLMTSFGIWGSNCGRIVNIIFFKFQMSGQEMCNLSNKEFLDKAPGSLKTFYL